MSENPNKREVRPGEEERDTRALLQFSVFGRATKASEAGCVGRSEKGDRRCVRPLT
jgi:hypothetical protein